MSQLVSLARIRTAGWVTALTVCAAVACGQPQEPDSFVGLWRGSNSVFTQFQLNLRSQSGDQIWGSALFLFAQSASTVADTDFVATITGDSLHFSQSVPPFTGYARVDFRGQRRGARIAGTANGVAITLARQ